MTGSELVALPGLVLPVEAVLLALDLESRGLRFVVDGDDLLVSPRDRITDVDRVAIRRWKWHLMALVARVERVQ